MGFGQLLLGFMSIPRALLLTRQGLLGSFQLSEVGFQRLGSLDFFPRGQHQGSFQTQIDTDDTISASRLLVLSHVDLDRNEPLIRCLGDDRSHDLPMESEFFSQSDFADPGECDYFSRYTELIVGDSEAVSGLALLFERRSLRDLLKEALECFVQIGKWHCMGIPVDGFHPRELLVLDRVELLLQRKTGGLFSGFILPVPLR